MKVIAYMCSAKQLDEELPFMTVEDLKKLNKVGSAYV